jgi:hypothetical protein
VVGGAGAGVAVAPPNAKDGLLGGGAMAFDSASAASFPAPPKFIVDFGGLPSVAGAVVLLLDVVVTPNETPPAGLGSVLGASFVPALKEKPGVLGASALLLSFSFAILVSLGDVVAVVASLLPPKENPPFGFAVADVASVLPPNENPPLDASPVVKDAGAAPKPNPDVAVGLVTESLLSFFSSLLGLGMAPNENPGVAVVAAGFDCDSSLLSVDFVVVPPNENPEVVIVAVFDSSSVLLDFDSSASSPALEPKENRNFFADCSFGDVESSLFAALPNVKPFVAVAVAPSALVPNEKGCGVSDGGCGAPKLNPPVAPALPAPKENPLQVIEPLADVPPAAAALLLSNPFRTVSHDAHCLSGSLLYDKHTWHFHLSLVRSENVSPHPSTFVRLG